MQTVIDVAGIDSGFLEVFGGTEWLRELLDSWLTEYFLRG